MCVAAYQQNLSIETGKDRISCSTVFYMRIRDVRDKDKKPLSCTCVHCRIEVFYLCIVESAFV